MFYFFFLATATLVTHDIIKQSANKGKKETDEDYITDRNIHIMGGVLAYFCLFFARSFYYQSFLGMSLN